MRNTIVFIAIGFILAYVIQEVRMQKKDEKRKADALASAERIKDSIINDIKGAFGKRKAEKIVNDAIDNTSSFCGC